MSNATQGSVQHEKLEIPSKAVFERRFLVNNSQPTSKPVIAAPQPPSALLNRLQSFLPTLQNANQQLYNLPAEKVQMEQASDEEGTYVELDLACGLFDLKDQAAVAAAERTLVNSGVVVERFGGESSSTDDSSDDECSNLSGGPVTDAAVGEDVVGQARPGQASRGAQHAQQHSDGGRSTECAQQVEERQQARGAERAKQRRQAKQRKRRAKIEVLS